MSQRSLKYIGTNRLPTKIAEFELDRLFSLTPEEINDIRRHFRRDHHVPAAVQLVFLRVAGRTFDAYEIVPRVLLAHLGRQLELDAPNIAGSVAIRKIGQGNWPVGLNQKAKL